MAIVTTLGSSLFVALVTSAWLWRRLSRVPKEARQATRRARRSLASRMLQVRRRRQVGHARAEGVSVVTSVTGTDPAIVRFDGIEKGTRYDYRDPRRLRADVVSRRVHHLATSCCGKPPRVGDTIRTTR